jgi:hypothetical protein
MFLRVQVVKLIDLFVVPSRSSLQIQYFVEEILHKKICISSAIYIIEVGVADKRCASIHHT